MAENRFWNLLGKKLSGEALPEEIKELEQLMRDHPDLIYSVDLIENLWKEDMKKTDEYDAELAFDMHLNKLKAAGIDLFKPETPLPVSEFTEEKKKSFFKKRFITASVFASILLAAVLIWFNRTAKPAPNLPSKNFSEASTRLGSKTKLVLPDSTVVWLNAGSKLSYGENFGIVTRNVTLIGEAFFDVKKTKIPFIIQANSVQIKVLGTAFNVKSYPNDKTTETSLIRGKVEITLNQRPGEKFILNPNEKLTVTNEPEKIKQLTGTKKEPMVVLSAITHINENTIVETSWVENKLIFQDESFADLARKMERWYGVTIEIRSEKIAAERLTGTFTTETIQEALEILQMSTAFRFTIKSNSIQITQ